MLEREVQREDSLGRAVADQEEVNQKREAVKNRIRPMAENQEHHINLEK